MLRARMLLTAAAAVAAVALGGAGTELRAEYNRRTAIVEAVQKTKDSIVTVKVQKGRKEIIGTGVIVDERGYVITNHHVVSGAESMTVVLWNGRELRPK